MRLLYLSATLFSIALALTIGFVMLNRIDQTQPTPARAVAACPGLGPLTCAEGSPGRLASGSSVRPQPVAATATDDPPIVFLISATAGDDGEFVATGPPASVVAVVGTEAGDIRVRAEIAAENARRALRGLAAILVIDMRTP